MDECVPFCQAACMSMDEQRAKWNIRAQRRQIQTNAALLVGSLMLIAGLVTFVVLGR